MRWPGWISRITVMLRMCRHVVLHFSTVLWYWGLFLECGVMMCCRTCVLSVILRMWLQKRMGYHAAWTHASFRPRDLTAATRLLSLRQCLCCTGEAGFADETHSFLTSFQHYACRNAGLYIHSDMSQVERMCVLQHLTSPEGQQTATEVAQRFPQACLRNFISGESSEIGTSLLAFHGHTLSSPPLSSRYQQRDWWQQQRMSIKWEHFLYSATALERTSERMQSLRMWAFYVRLIQTLAWIDAHGAYFRRSFQACKVNEAVHHENSYWQCMEVGQWPWHVLVLYRRCWYRGRR